MSINISDLFAKLGKIGGVLTAADYYRSGLSTKYGDISGAFSADRDILDTLYSNLSSAQSLPFSTCQYIQDLARATLVRIVNNDQPQINMTPSAAMGILIDQMVAGSQTVAANTVGMSTSVGGSNTGNPTFLSSIKRHDGRTSEYAFAEAIKAKVALDSYSGGSVVNSETVAVAGAIGLPSDLSPGWPKGSGAVLNYFVVDPAEDAQGGYLQYLTNGDFESFSTPNIPDNWTIVAGSAGSSILKVTTTTFDGSSSLGFVGDGSTQHSVTQAFASGSGTASSLVPMITYGVSVWIRVATVPAAGVLTVDLINGSGTVNDAQGNANSFTKNLNTLTANTWTNITGVFRTPAAATTNYALRLRCSTAISSGTTLLIDRVALTALKPLYPGGPMFSFIAGNTPVLYGDSWTATVTNNRAGSFQSLADRLFGMRAMGYQLPSSGAPSILDSYIPAP